MSAQSDHVYQPVVINGTSYEVGDVVTLKLAGYQFEFNAAILGLNHDGSKLKTLSRGAGIDSGNVTVTPSRHKFDIDRIEAISLSSGYQSAVPNGSIPPRYRGELCFIGRGDRSRVVARVDAALGNFIYGVEVSIVMDQSPEHILSGSLHWHNM